jgi:hypothetical protein
MLCGVVLYCKLLRAGYHDSTIDQYSIYIVSTRNVRREHPWRILSQKRTWEKQTEIPTDAKFDFKYIVLVSSDLQQKLFDQQAKHVETALLRLQKQSKLQNTTSSTSIQDYTPLHHMQNLVSVPPLTTRVRSNSGTNSPNFRKAFNLRTVVGQESHWRRDTHDLKQAGTMCTQAQAAIRRRSGVRTVVSASVAASAVV